MSNMASCHKSYNIIGTVEMGTMIIPRSLCLKDELKVEKIAPSKAGQLS